jgi:hypothetical protein
MGRASQTIVTVAIAAQATRAEGLDLYLDRHETRGSAPMLHFPRETFWYD